MCAPFFMNSILGSFIEQKNKCRRNLIWECGK